MIDSVAKAKRDELILHLQGTSQEPRLKNIREKLLDIKTSIELAEILDITRPTISKLEKCVNKLSGAQYLAICSLIEKKKNEILVTLDDISLNEKDFMRLARAKLFVMSPFYDTSFMFNLIDLETFKKKNNEIGYARAISNLRKYTCLDKWMDTINYNEFLSNDYVEKLIDNGDIIIDFSSFNCISDLNNILNKYTKSDTNNKSCMYFLYKDLLKLLDKIQDDIENKKINEEALNFLLKVSILIKNRKMEPMIYDEITGHMGRGIKERPCIFIVQNENIAKNIKRDIMYNMHIGKSTNDLQRMIESFICNSAEICKYEDDKLKRWLFDFESIRNDILSLNDNEKKHYESRRKNTLILNIYSDKENNITAIDTVEKYKVFDDNQEKYINEYEEGRKVMAEKLENLIQQILKQISPNY